MDHAQGLVSLNGQLDPKALALDPVEPSFFVQEPLFDFVRPVFEADKVPMPELFIKIDGSCSHNAIFPKRKSRPAAG